MCVYFCAVWRMEARGGWWVSSYLSVYLFMTDPPATRLYHWTWGSLVLATACTPPSIAPGLGSHCHRCTGVCGSCCPVTFSTELFSQADRYFKVYMDSYFSKLGNGESSNTKGGIHLSRYLWVYPSNALSAEGYRVVSCGPCPWRLSIEVTI